MEKKILYSVERRIKKIEIEEGFYAYRDETWIAGEQVEIIEGIAYKEEIERVEKNEPIKDVQRLLLFPKIALTIIKQNPWHKAVDLIQKENGPLMEPYTYIQLNGVKDVSLLDCNAHVDGNFYDVKGERILGAQLFNYMNGSLNNLSYDLKECLALLKERDDIVLLSDGIIDIPWYNAESDCDKMIEFLWIPKEEHREVLMRAKNSRGELELIKEEILKLPQKIH